MDVVDIAGVIRRRWRVVVPALAVTVILVVLALFVLPPAYSSRGSVLVKDSVASTSPITPALFAESLQDLETTTDLRNAGAVAPYTVTAVDDLLRVQATALSSDSAVATVSAVLDTMGPKLASLEEAEGVEEELRSTVNVVNVPLSATPMETTEDATGWVASGAAQVVGANDGAPAIRADTMRDALIEVLSSGPAADGVAEAGGTADYEFGFQQGSPILGIEATSSDREEAVRTVDALIGASQEQSKVLAEEAGQKVTEPLLQELVVPTSASVQRQGALRSVLAIGIVGIGLAIALAVAVEGVSAWWQRKANDDISGDRVRAEPGDDEIANDDISGDRVRAEPGDDEIANDDISGDRVRAEPGDDEIKDRVGGSKLG